jgi:hypothetical protein
MSTLNASLTAQTTTSITMSTPQISARPSMNNPSSTSSVRLFIFCFCLDNVILKSLSQPSTLVSPTRATTAVRSSPAASMSALSVHPCPISLESCRRSRYTGNGQEVVLHVIHRCRCCLQHYHPDCHRWHPLLDATSQAARSEVKFLHQRHTELDGTTQ